MRLRLSAPVLLLAATVASLGLAAEGYTADPGSPSAYYSLDGKPPKRFPSNTCLLTVCLGGSVQRARAVLGREGSRFPTGKGTTAGDWSIPRRAEAISLTLTWDRAGSISELVLAIAPRHPRVRVALPQRLVLGASRMGDVRRRFAHVVDKRWSAATAVFYEYRISLGPGGSRTLVFDYTTTQSGSTDPRGFNARLDSKPITNIKICYSRDACP